MLRNNHKFIVYYLLASYKILGGFYRRCEIVEKRKFVLQMINFGGGIYIYIWIRYDFYKTKAYNFKTNLKIDLKFLKRQIWGKNGIWGKIKNSQILWKIIVIIIIIGRPSKERIKNNLNIFECCWAVQIQSIIFYYIKSRCTCIVLN